MHHALVLSLALSANPPVAPAPREPPAAAATREPLATAAPRETPATAASREPPATAAPAASSSDARDLEPDPRDQPAPRRLRITGYVALFLGVGLLAGSAASAAFHARTLARLDRRAHDLTPGQRLSPTQRLGVQLDVASARIDRNIAIGTGVAAAASFALATTLFLLARRRARTPRLALAPTWLPAGAGLVLQLRLP